MCLYFGIKISCQKFANPPVGNPNLQVTESIFFRYAGQQGQIPYSHFELPLKQDVTETSDIFISWEWTNVIQANEWVHSE